MWENITHQEKGGIVSHVATCYIFLRARFRTSKPASHQPIDAARDRPSVVPSACGPQAHADPAFPSRCLLGGPGPNVREVAYEEAHEMAAPSRKRHLGGEARRALELFIDPNRKTQAVLLELITHANPSAAFHLACQSAPI